MAVTVITKSRVGFSTALVAFLAMGGSEVLTRTRISVRDEALVCGAFAFAGLISWIKGWVSQAGRVQRSANGSGQGAGGALPVRDDSDVDPLAFLRHAKYWGGILVVSAGMMYLMCVWVHRRPTAQTPPPIAEAKPVVVPFPPLKLQGVVNNGTKSTAVINGMTLCLGEMIDGVRLQSVEREQVTVELAGRTKVLALPQ